MIKKYKKDNRVYNYYNNQGWELGQKNVMLDEEINVNNNSSCNRYNKLTRERVSNILKKYKGKKIKLLDVASGPLHIKEFLEYSKSFSERHCVDFSKLALKKAKINLIKNGQKKCFFYNIDFLNNKFRADEFDCAVSMHTLYHVGINKQREFVNKLIKCVKPNSLVIIVYSNPFSLQSLLTLPMLVWREFKSYIKKILIKISLYKEKNDSLYFKRKSIFWWNNFKRSGEVKLIAERTFSASFEKKIIPNNNFGKKVYNFLFYIENFSFWKYFSAYYIVIIKKKNN